VFRGDPGYGSHLDRDGDGLGCETWDSTGGTTSGPSGPTAPIVQSQLTLTSAVPMAGGVHVAGELVRTVSGVTMGSTGLRVTIEAESGGVWTKLVDAPVLNRTQPA
jgi:Excalibur calcium-binding domain